MELSRTSGYVPVRLQTQLAACIAVHLVTVCIHFCISLSSVITCIVEDCLVLE